MKQKCKEAPFGEIYKTEEEVIVSMRIPKFIYDGWKLTAKEVGVSMIDLLTVLIMYSPSHKRMRQNWPWYAGYPDVNDYLEQEKQ
jgi:hypothetical protein